jgi:hypothetical protein
VPADDKHYMRMIVAETVVAGLRRLDLHYPRPDPADREEWKELRRRLEESAG